MADSIAYLHNGQLLFHENKDELLQSYGVLHCGEDVLTSLPAGLVVFTRRGAYGCESLVRERRTVQELSLIHILVLSARFIGNVFHVVLL